jgi:hypothetical protein
VRDDGDQKHLVTCHHEGDAVEAGVPRNSHLVQVYTDSNDMFSVPN